MDEMLLKRLLDHQTGTILRSMCEQQTAFLTSMREQQTAFLTSISEHLAKLNASIIQNKVEDEDHKKKGKWGENVTKTEEVTCDDDSDHLKQFHESTAPWPLSCSSRTDEKKYRLHIVGEVCHEEIPDGEGNVMKRNVIRGKQIPRIEVILKHGDEQVPASHHLASLRVELVVLDAKYHVEESSDWPRKEFEDHLMMVSKTSNTRMTVQRGIFSLDGGRKVYTGASINESSWKQKVRLGVMVVQDGRVQERVLEGVSSNEFLVIHERRRDAHKESKRQITGDSELNTNGKRVNSETTLQRTSCSQYSGHAQSTQNFGRHATSEQTSYAPNPTAPIGPPQTYAPNSDQGLTTSVQMKLDDNQGISFEEAYGNWLKLNKHDDNRGHHHVDLSSQDLLMGNNGTGGGQGQPTTAATADGDVTRAQEEGLAASWEGARDAKMHLGQSLEPLDLFI